jgi:hypothetical protein
VENKSQGMLMFFGGLRSWMFYVYVLVLLLCFLLFQQGDLAHTTTSSYAYLNGHFLNFYDYNKKILGANDYLPLIYLIFSLWNLPLHLFKLITPEKLQLPFFYAISIAWAKLLLIVFFFASVKVVQKISQVVVDGINGSKQEAAYLFATAPIAIFAVFIFSQYDIIGLFFTLLGIYFYLKKDFTRFSWFFSVAICFKYFALGIYIPLILVIEKKISKIVKYLLIGISVTVAQLLAYSPSEAFREHIFYLVLGKVSGVYGTGLSFHNLKLYTIIIYLLGCFYLYLKKFKFDFEWKRMAILVPIAAYGLMFLTVVWHPQWLIIVTPFFALSYIFIKNRKLLAYMDMLGMLSFIWICVNTWAHNVDVGMISYGVLRSFIPPIPLIISDFMRLSLLPIFKMIFGVYLFSPILIILYERFFMRDGCFKEIGNRLLFIRFFVGISIFLIPALICTFIPISLAVKINPDAFLVTHNMVVLSNSAEVAIGEIINEDKAIQTFKPKLNGLSAVSVMLATYARPTEGEIKFRLEDNNGKNLIEKVVSAKAILDNSYYNFTFEPILDSKDKTYRLIMWSEGSPSGKAITAWASKKDVYPEGKLTFKGDELSGDIAMKIYFDPKVKN